MSDRDRAKSGGKTYHQQQQQQQQQLQQNYEDGFDYTLPRPPALGEERKGGAAASLPNEWLKTYKASSPLPVDECQRASSAAAPSQLPACFSWAHSLHNLLQDPDGAKLFSNYLKAEWPQHAIALDFWFACEGLKKRNEAEIIHKLVKLIYKKFMKSALPINDELRREIMRKLRSPQCLDPPVTLFDQAQAQVERQINDTTYPDFLKSDTYLRYLQSVQNPGSGSEDLSSDSSSPSSSVSNRDLMNLAGGLGPLPTLHEDLEFTLTNPLVTTPGTGNVSTGYHTPTVPGTLRLTKNMLLKSQNYRALDIRPKSETYAGLFASRTGIHAAYSSYNPVSRQDSEMQSLSSHSDARTESDNLSLAESAADNWPSGRARRKASLEAKHTRELAALNKETNMHETFIPRTQRIDASKCDPMDLDEHAAVLYAKLESLKREMDSKELVARKLKESDSMSSLDDKNRNEMPLRELDGRDNKLAFQDDIDEDILGEHVSRVFSEPSLAMSPGLSPRPLSPQHRNRFTTQSPYMRQRRKDKDGFSTFSGDSGNVHDFTEGSEHKLSMVKSKSTPDYGDDHRFGRVNITCRRSSSKKTLADLTDSGVSVVSDTPSVGAGNKDRVLHWLMESNKSGKISLSQDHAYSEMAVREGVGRKYNKKGYGSRSNSLERNSVTGSLGPAQPFVADPNMPPLPHPNTAMQLEEARRRLEDDIRTKSRQRISNKYPNVVQSSGQSTLRKSLGGIPPRPLTTGEDVTTVVFSFCDEQFPYRTKILGSQVTLRQFKEILPKKGNYRYFFKTICEDLGNQVTHEEVSNDIDVLPLWEGKIMAQVKPID